MKTLTPIAGNGLGSVLSSSWPRVLLFALTLGLCALALKPLGYAHLLLPWTRTSTGVLALAVVLQGLSYAARAARLAQSEVEIGWPKFWIALRLVLLHNLANLLLPMRSGELSFPWLMQRWLGIDPVRAGGVLLFLRLADVQVLACLGLIAALSLWQPAGSALWVGFGACLGVSAPLLCWVLARRVRGLPGTRPWVRRVALGIPESRRDLVTGLAWTWLAWAIKLCGLALLFADLAQAPPALGLMVALGGDASSVLPIHAPGGIGTYEAGALLLAAPWAAPSADLIASIIGLHAFVLTVALALGALAAVLPGAPSRPPPSTVSDP